MLKQLKRRFILLAMLSMTVTLILAFTAVNITLRVRLAKRTDEIIDILHENGGIFPISNNMQFFYDTDSDNNSQNGNGKKKFHDETPFQTRYYIAYVDSSNSIINEDYSHIAVMNIDMIMNQVCQIRSAKKDRGYIDTYRYGRFETDDGLMVIGVDWICRPWTRCLQ